MADFDRCTPEETGIASEYIEKTVDKLIEGGVDMHSLLIMKNGKLVYERYFIDRGANDLNRLFSVTKSFTAIGVGLLIDEGKVDPDEKIVSYFPEKVTGQLHPWIAEMTVRNCLMMRTCYEKTTYNKFDMSSDWVGSFFTSEPSHRPGMIFHYDTGAAHVLCALVEKLSGMKLMDYMRLRLPEVGFSGESYVIEGPMGISQGGTGLMATPYDMLKFGKFIMDRGCVNGKQLIDSSYIEMITSKLTPTSPTASNLFEGYGYGCQFWRSKHGCCCYGMGGQMIFLDEEHNMIVATTADTQGHSSGMQALHDAINEELIEKLGVTEKKSEIKHSASFCEKFRTSGAGDFSELELSYDEDTGYIEYPLQGQKCRIEFGISEAKYGRFPIYDMLCSAKAEWLSEGIFYIYVRLLDTSMASVRFTVSMDERGAVLFMRKTEETMFGEYTGHLTYEYA